MRAELRPSVRASLRVTQPDNSFIQTKNVLDERKQRSGSTGRISAQIGRPGPLNTPVSTSSRACK